MKVGILTFHFSDNYGALFQAYALKKWFEQNGHQAYFVEYHPSYVESGGEFSLKNIFSKSTLKVAFLKASKIYQALYVPAEFPMAMACFRSEKLGVMTEVVQTIDSAMAMPITLGTDMLVCGSDQIWNPPEHYGVDPVYFLDFLEHKGVRLISYAPSFGSNSLNSLYADEIARLVVKLDAVSIREESGADIIRNIANVEAKVVPDPTLLPVDFSPILEGYPGVSENYCFCYYLRSVEGVRETIAEIRSTNAIDVLEVHNPHRRWQSVGDLIYPSPGQWLSLLKKSKVVVTNSFHGVALSIINNKEFLFVALRGNKSKMNARAEGLLEKTGLKNRAIYSNEEIKGVLESSIDWAAVNSKIEALREVGAGFLMDQVGHCESENE